MARRTESRVAPGSTLTRYSETIEGNPRSDCARRRVTKPYWITNAFVPALRPVTRSESSWIRTTSPTLIASFAANARSSTISSSLPTECPATISGGPPAPVAGSNPARKSVACSFPRHTVVRNSRTGDACRTPAVSRNNVPWERVRSDDPRRMFVAFLWRTQRSAGFLLM